MTKDELDSLLAQIRNPNKRNWILMVPNSLGETVTVCGFAKSFLETHGFGITLVIPQSHALIAQCYPDTFDRVVYLPLVVMRQFTETGYIPQNFFAIDFPYNTWPMQNGDGRIFDTYKLWIESVGAAGLSYLNLYRYILRLKWNAEFVKPAIPLFLKEKSNNFCKINKINKKTVLLFVGNNTAKPASIALWRKIALYYQQQGMDVVINKFGSMLLPDDLEIPKTRFVDIPLDVALSVCEQAESFVSGSNGFAFFALAANIDCNMHFLMSNAICYDYTKILYKSINYLEGCHQLTIPEITSKTNKLKEWIVPEVLDDIALNEIAYGIAYNSANNFTIVN